jgi:hypothetical protein
LRRRPARTLPPPRPPESPWALARGVVPPAVEVTPARPDHAMTSSTAAVAPPGSRRGHALVGAMLVTGVSLLALLLFWSVSREASALAEPPPAAPAAATSSAATVCTPAPAPPAPTLSEAPPPRPPPRVLSAHPRKKALAPAPAAPQAAPPQGRRDATAKRNSGRLFDAED